MPLQQLHRDRRSSFTAARSTGAKRHYDSSIATEEATNKQLHRNKEATPSSPTATSQTAPSRQKKLHQAATPRQRSSRSRQEAPVRDKRKLSSAVAIEKSQIAKTATEAPIRNNDRAPIHKQRQRQSSHSSKYKQPPFESLRDCVLPRQTATQTRRRSLYMNTL